MTTLADYDGPIPLDHPMVLPYGAVLKMQLRNHELNDQLTKLNAFLKKLENDPAIMAAMRRLADK